MRTQARREIRERLFQTSPICSYCDRRLMQIRNATLDHVVPLSLGGRDEESNLVLTCRDCNACKAGRDAADLFRWAERILLVASTEGGVR